MLCCSNVHRIHFLLDLWRRSLLQGNLFVLPLQSLLPDNSVLSLSLSPSVFVFWNVLLFLQQVRGGFLNDRESSIPLGIMSFKTTASSSSPECVSSFVSTSSQAHHDNDKDAEEKEVTVHLMKEEAGYYSLFVLDYLIPFPGLRN